MNNKRAATFLLLSVLIGLFVAQTVSAAAGGAPSAVIFNAFERIFGDFGETYEEHGLWVDLIIYLFLFVFTTRFALGQQQGFGQGTAGRSLGVVVGVVLAIAATVFEANSGFRLGNLGPWATGLALLVIAYVIYRFIHGIGFGGYQSAAIAFLVAYGFALSVGQPIFDRLSDEAETNAAAAWGLAILDFLFAIAVLALVYMLVTRLPHMFGQGGGFGNILGGAPGGGGGQQGAHAAQQAANQAAQQTAQAQLLAQHTQMYNQLNHQIGQLQQAIQQGAQQQTHLIQQLGGAIQQLHQVDQQILQMLGRGGNP